MVGPLTLAAVLVRRRSLPGWSGAPAVVAEVVVVLGLLIGIAETIGVVGLLRPGVLIGASLACGLAAWRWVKPRGPDVHPPPPPAEDPVAAGIAALSTAALTGFWVAGGARTLKQGLGQSDTLAYHAPIAARFVQEHSTAHHLFPTGEQVLVFVPANSELLHAIGILLMGDDLLSPLLNIGWLALALVAAWAIGRPYGRGSVTLTGAVAALATPLFLAGQPGEAFNDVAAAALVLAVAALLVNGRGQPASLVLAGLAAGLAAGTKATMLLPVAAFTLVAIALVRAGERVRTGSLLIAAVLAGGGFWYLRNLVAFGSPLPTVRIGIGPLALPSVPSRAGYTVADYATNWHVWHVSFHPALRASLGPGWWALLGLAALGAALSLVRASSPARRTLGVLAIAIAVFYAFTPYSADGPKGNPYYFAGTLRFLVPGLALGLALLALAAVFEGRARRRSMVVVFGLLTFAAFRDSRHLVEDHSLAAALGAAAVLVPVAVAGASRVGTARTHLVPRGAGLVAVTALLVLAVGLVWKTEGRYMGDRYPTSWARALHETRIGTVGAVPAYPLYGRDLSNHVQYIARHGPHGAFTRLRDCREWRRAVDEGRYRYVAISTAVDLIRAVHGQAETHTREVAWTASDRDATLLPAAGRDSIVFRIDGRLHPDACSTPVVRGTEREILAGVPIEDLTVRRRAAAERFRRVRLTLDGERPVIHGWSAVDIAVTPGVLQGFVDAIPASGDRVTATGWAADTARRRSAGWVLAFSGRHLVAASAPSVLRLDLAKSLTPDVELSGYTLPLPATALGHGRALRVFGIDGQRASELKLSDLAQRDLRR